MAAQSKRGLSATKTRSAGMKGGSAAGSKAGQPATKKRPAPQIQGEKSVRQTRKTMDLKPLKVTREAERPMDERAVDRRKQVFDDPAK